MAKGVIFGFWKAKIQFLGIFLLIPQTAALIFCQRVAHFSNFFDRLIGNYYFTLKQYLLEVAYFFMITDMNLCKD
jgi:hypothetical protein